MKFIKYVITLLFIISFTFGAVFSLNDDKNRQLNRFFSPNHICLSHEIEWGLNGTEICTADAEQINMQICSDGQGGAFIVWEDYRNWQTNIYIQRISPNGTIMWNPNGVHIYNIYEFQYEPKIICDGEGGAIIVWEDHRGLNIGDTGVDIYAQKINSTGQIQWAPEGLGICINTRYQAAPNICSDGKGGAIIAWCEDSENNLRLIDIYAQRVYSNGSFAWNPNGVIICGERDFQDQIEMIADGNGGTIVVWRDRRSGVYGIYGQRVNYDGIRNWTSNGLCITALDGYQEDPQICSDGEGGVIITWRDGRDAFHNNWDIFAQRVKHDGSINWTDNGVPICTMPNAQGPPKIYNTSDGGSIIVWQDNRDGVQWDVYAQKINSNGLKLWEPSQGLEVYSGNGDQTNVAVCNDGADGAIIVWDDMRDLSQYDIYIQRLDFSGIKKWGINGTRICAANEDQKLPKLCMDGAGGAIIAWEDYRFPSNDPYEPNNDIYCQHVKNAIPTSNHPNDMEIQINQMRFINWTLFDDYGGGKYRVILNDSNGDSKTIVNWNQWQNNSKIDILIRSTNSGISLYIIEFYDDQNQYGIKDIVLCMVLAPKISIPFGNFYFLFSVLAILSIVILKISQKKKKINYPNFYSRKFLNTRRNNNAF